VKLETGDDGLGGPTKPIVETEYDSCGCSPLGKVKKVSLPYAPNATKYWTEYEYDGLGRTLTVKQPNNSGNVTYSYAANTVTVTDAAGKWKKYETDALGNLVTVTEQDPVEGQVLTTYEYNNPANKLTNVLMTRSGVTQPRSFVYDLQQPSMRLYPRR
jgi:purine nucleoside permease